MAGFGNQRGGLTLLGWLGTRGLRAFPSATEFGGYHGYWPDRNPLRRRFLAPMDIYGGHGVTIESVGGNWIQGA